MDYRSRYSPGKKKDKRSKILFKSLVILLFLLIICLIIYLIHHSWQESNDSKDQAIQLKDSYQKLFNDKNYLELIKKMDQELIRSPFQVEYLTYRGYSYFLLGEEEKDYNRQKKFFIRSLIDLRKVTAIGMTEKNSANIYFCIGKIYYYLDRPYYLLSIKYLQKSLQAGNKRNDLLYILGLVYSYIGDYTSAIDVFKQSLQSDQSDLVILAIGINYYKNNNDKSALQYLEKAVKISNNEKIIEKSLFTIGEINFNNRQYTQARDFFNQVLELNENNADAYFYKGEIYFLYNNLVKARAEWRKTLDIDPSHIQAKKRLYY